MVLTYDQFVSTPQRFIPSQDMGYMLLNIQLPDSASDERTAQVIREVEKIAHGVPGIKHVTGITGQSFALNAIGSNFGSCFIGLDDYANRRDPERWSPAIVARLNKEFAAIPDAMVQVFPPPPVRGVGRAGGFTLMVEDRGDIGLSELQAQTENLVRMGNEDPRLANLFSAFRANVPMLKVDPDLRECMEKGVNLRDFADTLQVYQGSLYVNDFNLFGRTWQVIVQAEHPFRDELEDISKLKVRNSDRPDGAHRLAGHDPPHQWAAGADAVQHVRRRLDYRRRQAGHQLARRDRHHAKAGRRRPAGRDEVSSGPRWRSSS